MEAKDTVMNNKQLEKEMRKDYPNFSIKEQSDEISDILMWTRETQAEISFKAGETTERKRLNEVILPQLLAISKSLPASASDWPKHTRETFIMIRQALKAD